MNRIKKYQIPFGPLTIQQWGNEWKERLQPSAKSKVIQKWNVTGKKPESESSKEYTNRRIAEETKRTWRSEAADIAHGIGEGILAFHPYTAIPYYGAKVGQDFLNGTYGWQTALNASIPLFHLSPQINNGINILNKNTSKVPLKSQSLSKFVNPDNTINVNNSVEAIKEGKNWAVQYLQSEAKKQTNQHNLQLAQKIGLKLFRPFNEASQRVAVPNKVKIINERGNMEGGSVWTDSKNPALDETTINVSQNPYYSSLHENLHRGYVGNAPKEYYLNEPRGTFGDTNKFYEWLKEKTLKPWSERHNLPGAEYLDKPEELAVNLIEAGQRMGLKIGQQYPGKQKALELMEKYRLSGDYKSGVIDLLNLKKPKRAWKGLTGTLFSLPFIYGYNSNGQKNIQ